MKFYSILFSCAAIVSLWQVSLAMKRVFKLILVYNINYIRLILVLISGQLHLLAAVPSAHCRWRITHRNRTGHSKPAFVRSNYTYTEQEQDIPAADHTHISDVLHSCAALCCQQPLSVFNQLSEITTHKAMLCKSLQESGQRSCD